jgi:hypothetical protein
MADNDRCEICGHKASLQSGTFDGLSVDCDRCGPYEITSNALGRGRKLSNRQKALVSGWLREQSEIGALHRLYEKDIKRIAQLPFPAMAERADRLLQYVERHQERLGDSFTIVSDPAFTAISYARDAQERLEVVKFLEWREHIERGNDDGERRITSAGYEYLDQLRQRQPDSSQAFVAMWFSPDLGRVFDDGFSAGIAAAGYKPVRVDLVEHAGKIDDEIIAQIKRSKFIVADFTGQRGGVYFEAGFALGLNLPVIWTCHEDHIGDLHFDTRQFNCLLWKDDFAELARRLQMRIEAVVGRGPIDAGHNG